MSSIDIQKLGLPTHPRTKEIIEEDYPSVSLTNRMRIIQKQFAERQTEEPKDLTKPPENVQQIFYNFESIFNQLLGLMKRFITMNVQSVRLSNISQIVQSYLQLSSVYNSFVLPQLPSNELLRRQIYEKLDQLASASGHIINGLMTGTLRIFDDNLASQIPPQITSEYVNLFESIRRDALTRLLRPVSFGSDFPLPGQPRSFNRGQPSNAMPPNVPPPQAPPGAPPGMPGGLPRGQPPRGPPPREQPQQEPLQPVYGDVASILEQFYTDYEPLQREEMLEYFNQQINMKKQRIDNDYNDPPRIDGTRKGLKQLENGTKMVLEDYLQLSNEIIQRFALNVRQGLEPRTVLNLLVDIFEIYYSVNASLDRLRRVGTQVLEDGTELNIFDRATQNLDIQRLLRGIYENLFNGASNLLRVATMQREEYRPFDRYGYEETKGEVEEAEEKEPEREPSLDDLRERLGEGKRKI